MSGRVRLLFVLIAVTSTRALIDETVDVILLSKQIGEEVLNSWDVIGKPFNASSGVELPFIRKRERQVLARLSEITRAIQKLELEVDKSSVVATLLAKNVGRGARLELRLYEMADLLSSVDSADRTMREYVKLQQELEKRTLEDFANWCVSHDRGALPGLMERIHALIAPPYKHLFMRGLLELIVDDLEVCNTFTFTEISPLQKFSSFCRPALSAMKSLLEL